MIIKEYVPYTKNVEVTEKRAPTDESIRLYKEMEEKAERNIINKEVFDDNVLNGIIAYVEYSAACFVVKAHIRFSLNGKNYHIVVEVPRSSISRQEGAKLLYTAIIEELAKEFTIEIIKIKV